MNNKNLVEKNIEIVDEITIKSINKTKKVFISLIILFSLFTFFYNPHSASAWTITPTCGTGCVWAPTSFTSTVTTTTTKAFTMSITSGYGSAAKGGTCTGTWVSPTFTLPIGVNAACTLTGTVSPISYSITFNSNGGTAVSTITQAFNTAVTAPTNPTRTCYAFTGWSPTLATNMPVGGQALTAQWSAASCTPTVANATVSSISYTSATISSNVTSAGNPATLTARGVCAGSGGPGNCIAEGGTATGAFSKIHTGLTAGTTYYAYGYATNATGTNYSSGGTSFTTTSYSAPTIVTQATPTSITQTSATSGGNISSNGGATVSVSGLVWSTSINPTTASNQGKTTDGWALPGVWYSNLTGLTCNTLYHHRAYATNPYGTSYGSDVSFTTSACSAVPTVTTPTSSSPTTTSAILGATVTSLGNPASITARGTCWGTSSPTTNCTAAAGTTTGAFTHTRTNMACSTGYFYRGYATNSFGTGYSADAQVFTTGCPTAPTVTTPTYSATSNTSATLGANITSAGSSAVTARGTCWNTTTTIANCLADGGTATGVFTHTRTGLACGVTNYAWGYATNAVGTSYTPYVGFSLSPCDSIPTITTPTSIAITDVIATLGADTISAGYPAALSSVGTCWNLSANPTLATGNCLQRGAALGPFSHTRNALSPNTLYHFRGYATNGIGTAYTSDATFTTLPSNAVPTVTTPTATSIGQTSVTLGGNITSAGYPTPLTSRGTCFSTLAIGVESAACLADGSTSTGVFTQARTGLSCGTFYYYVAYAINSTGKGYVSGTFTTLPCNVVPSISTPTSASVTQTTATLGANVTSLGYPATLTGRGVCYRAYGFASYTNGLSTCVSNLVSTTGAYTISATGLSCSSNYSYAGYAINSTGIAETTQGSFTTAACNNPPSVTLPTVSSVSFTTATLGATVTSLGIPSSISTRGTCWGTSASPTTNCSAEGGTTTGVFTQARTSMSPGTFYYYRGYATNTTGTGYSVDGTFTTTAVTVGVTASPTSYESTPSASVNFTFTSTTNTGVRECSLLDYTKSTLVAYSSSVANINYAISATPGSYGYYVRCRNTVYTSVVTDSALITVNVNSAPILTTPTSSSITQTSAVLGANMTSIGYPTGTTIVGRGTCWGTSAYPTTNCASNTTSTSLGSLATVRTGMTCGGGTTYYYRGYATNAYGTGYSPDGTFTTLPCDTIPSISNPLFPAGGSTSATFSAQITSAGIPATITHRGTCWALTADPAINCLDEGGTTVDTMTHSRTGLPSGAIVHFRGYVTNATGTAWTTDASIQLYKTAVIASPTCTVTGSTTLTLGANVTSLGAPPSITSRGTCWGTSASPTTNCLAEGGTTTGIFTQARTGFSPSTTYYYRGYADNSLLGRDYSIDGTCVTKSLLTVTNNNASATVTSSPAGISCGATCTYYYDNNTSVTVTAPALAGYSATISGGCAAGPSAVGVGTSCAVTMNAAKTVTVTYGDTTAPTAPGTMTTTWARDHWVNTSFIGSTTGSTDAGSGIRGYRLCSSLDNTTGCSTWTAAGEHAGTTETVSGTDLPPTGSYRYYYWYAYDNLSNQSAVSTGEYIRIDSTSPTYNSITFTGCNFETGMNCYVKNGTTFNVNMSHTDNQSGTNTQYFELSKDGLNRGSWDALTGNIKSYAQPYGVANGSLYGSYSEAAATGLNILDIQDVTCTQPTNCNVTALGRWRVIAGSAASAMYGVTAYMYDGVSNGVGYTDTSKYVYLDNDTPVINTPTDDGSSVASTSLNFYGTPSDASSGLSECYAQIDINNTDGLSLAMATTAVGFDGDHTFVGVAGNTYYYRYYCNDQVGNSAGWSGWTDGVAINNIPTVTTPTSSAVTTTTATLGGNVTDLGIPASISARGVCYGLALNPSLVDTCVTASGTTTGVFTVNVSSLTPGTTYHYRGYATNTTGTAYAPDATFATNKVPTVTTPTSSAITTTTATLGANVTDLGIPAAISARGVCYSTSANPTTPCVTASGTTTGVFTVNVSSLTSGTTYHYRGYATSASGTGYTSDATFGSMNGTLTASNCSITAAGTECNTTLVWNTTNPVATSAVTTDYPSAGTTAGTGNSSVGTIDAIPEGITAFYLYNNGILLATATATATRTAPAVPTGLISTPGACVTSGTGTNTVSWTASSGATSYTLQDNGVTIYTGAAISYPHTGIVVGSSHIYKVLATNTGGSSAYSTTINPAGPALCTYTLTIPASGGNGAGTYGGTVAGTYNYGTAVSVTSSPSAGSTFTNWVASGAAISCNGSVSVSCGFATNSAGSIQAIYTLVSNNLNITKAGTGTGTVAGVSSPVQTNIACGATCSRPYTYGTTVTLTATPDISSTFTGWSGGGCSGTGTCVASINGTVATQPVDVTATFAIKTNTLTIVSPGAILSPDYTATGAYTVNYGASPVVTAQGWAGYTIALSGGCTATGTVGNGAACTVTNMTANQTVTVAYTVVPYTLTVAKAGTGTGTVTGAPVGIACGATCTQSVNYGNAITLTAVPDASSTFTGWSGAGCSGTGTCVATITGAVTVTATFTIKSNTLTVTKVGTGTVTGVSAPAQTNINCGATCGPLSYTYGTTVTLTPVAGSGYLFTGWSGGTCSGTGACAPTINAATTVTATFSLMTGSITSSSPSCSIALNASTCSVNLTWSTTNPIGTSAVTAAGMTDVNGNSGTSVPFTIPYGGRTFFLYNSSILLAQTPAITVSPTCIAGAWNGSICAQYTVTPSITAGDTTFGIITPNTAQSADYNTTKVFTVNPNAGYTASVGGTCGGALVGTTYTTNPITANCTVIATFTINAFTVTPSAGVNVTITPNTAQAAEYNTTLEFTVTPTAGYLASVGGTCGGLLVGTTYTTNPITANCTVVASAGLMTGTITPTTSSCTIAANASSCSSTLNWSTTNPVATSAVTSATGTPSPANGNSGSQSFTAPYNVAGVIFTLYNNGVQLAQATINNSCAAGIWDGTKCAQYTVTSNNPANGTVTAPLSKAVNYNKTTTFNITPNAGYTASASGCGGTLNGNTYTTGAITASCNVTVSYSLNSFNLNYTAGVGGTLSGTASQAVNYGSNGTIVTAVPNTGYHFTGWSEGALHKFISGSSTFTPPAGVTNVELLVVAGGGGGGSSSYSSGGGGGGGAGGLEYYPSFSITEGTPLSVTVGAGGISGIMGASQSGVSGGNSSFGTINTTGGGYGGSPGVNGGNGGSGGGAGYNGYSVARSGGSAVSGEGYAGGSTPLLSWAGAAGGGGAAGVGQDNKINNAGGPGGPGVSNSISGSAITYARGGGGGTSTSAFSPSNTGQGGDGSYGNELYGPTGTPYAGGSGVVIVKYPITAAARQDTSVTSSKSPTASFAINSYTVTASAGANGTITAPLVKSVNYGATTTYTVTPTGGYVASMSGTCGGTLVGTTYTTNAIASDCTVIASFNLMTGTLSSNAGSCTIALNASNCTTSPNLTWTVSNPTGATTAITAIGMTDYTSPSVSGGGPTAFVVTYPSRLFHLYNNSLDLATVNVTATCAAGAWNGTICKQNNLTIVSAGGISGTYAAPGTYAVNYGASPVVTAAAWAGYSVAISGGCTASAGIGLGASCTVTNMIAAQTVTVTYSVSSNMLTVAKAGTGTGTVTSSPVGINCGATCSSSYNYGTSVTLTAVPSVVAPTAGSVFSGWSGGGCSGTGTCVTTMNSSFTVTATFSLMTGTLSSDAASCTIALNESTCNVNLSWSTGNAIGTSAVTASGMTSIDGDRGSSIPVDVPYNNRTFFLYNSAILLDQTTVTSSCAQGAWDGTVCKNNGLTVTNTGPGVVTSAPAGINCGATCTSNFDYNTVVTITAPAVVGHSVAISNGCTATGGIGIGASCSVTMSAARTVAVVYTVSTNSLSIIKAGTGTGTVTGVSSPTQTNINCGSTCSSPYSYGTIVTLTPTPTSGSSFTAWSGDADCSDGSITMNAAKSCTATFTVMAATLTSNFPSCVIALGASSCNVNLTWTVTNPIGATTAITATGMTDYTSPSVSGGGPTAFVVTYPSRLFHLYNNSLDLATVNVTAGTCASGAWNGTLCAIAPTVTTPTVSAITQSQAILGANVTALGYPTAISRGTCWGLTAAPTTNCVAEGGTTATVFTHLRTGLTPNTLIYYRGYATNATGTSYSPDSTFTTSTVTVSVVASLVTYNVLPSAALSFAYTPTTNTGTTECKLLDSTKLVDIKPYQATSPLTTTASATAGAYGYYVRCRNVAFPTYIADSALITVNAMDINVVASPTTFNVNPGAAVSFAYTPTITPTGIGASECRLLNNLSTQIYPLAGAYQATGPIVYPAPNSIGSYGYYVNCRNTILTTAVGTSGLITVNTSCPVGSTFNGTICEVPTGNLTATNCNIANDGDSCSTHLEWSLTSQIGDYAVTTPTSIIPVAGPGPENSGSTNYGPVPYSVYYGDTNFYLYNNGEILDIATPIATCTSGVNSWNSTSLKCVVPTGTLSVPACQIPENGTGCTSTPITWNVTDALPGLTSVVKVNGANMFTPTTVTSGTTSYPTLTPVDKLFTLVHNGINLSSITTRATCVENTHWNGSKCAIDAIATGNTIFEITPATIFKGRFATIHWEAPLADSCTGSSVPADAGFTQAVLDSSSTQPIMGEYISSPIVTTTYTLSCENASGTTLLPSKTTKVITLNIKEN